MKNFLIWIIIGVIILLSIIIVIDSLNIPSTSILSVGTFMVLALTLIALIIYAYDTHRLTSIAEQTWKKEIILNAAYTIEVYSIENRSDKILFKIYNPTTMLIKAKLNCDFEVYGVKVKSKSGYDGQKIWYVFPQQISQGWFKISELISQQGKTIDQMVSEYQESNRTTQLTLDISIEFRDELGNKRILPTRRYYFAFNEWNWIPVLTISEKWED